MISLVSRRNGRWRLREVSFLRECNEDRQGLTSLAYEALDEKGLAGRKEGVGSRGPV